MASYVVLCGQNTDDLAPCFNEKGSRYPRNSYFRMKIRAFPRNITYGPQHEFGT